jgi:hypothetical protein
MTRPRISLKGLGLFALFAAAAVYFYYFNLSGLSAPNSDENRVYHWNPFTPILYFICRPFTNFFRDQDAPYYVMATIAVMNVFLIHRLVRRFFTPRAALWAAAFYLLNDYAVCYSRQLYYSTLLVFLTLVGMTAYARSAQKKTGWLWLLLAGAMPGALFYTNPSGYVFILGFGVWILFIGVGVLRVTFGRLILQAVLMSFAAAAAYALLEAYSYRLVGARPEIPYKPQWISLVSYREINAAEGSGFGYLLRVLGDIWRYIVVPDVSQLFRTSLIAFTAAASVFWAWKKRLAPLAAFAAFGIVCGAVTLTAVAAGTHGLYMRNLSWIVPPLAVGFGFAADAFLGSASARRRAAAGLLLAVYFVFAAVKAWAVVHSFFSVDDINGYLEKNGIPKTRVMTLFQINRYEDFAFRRTTQDVPLVRTYNPAKIKKNIYYHIHWPLALKAYQQGKVKYYLSSSIGNMANVDIEDPLVLNTKPVMLWENHPLNNRHTLGAFFHFDERYWPYRIGLYRLEDIFATAARLKAERSAASAPGSAQAGPS